MSPRRILRDLRFHIEWALSPRLRSIYLAEPSRAVLEEFRWKIAAGPFEGMSYCAQSSGSSLAPKLLGCYERELHQVIADVLRGTYTRIIDVGCAEGYYAVGLAWKTGIPVTAYDTDPQARDRLEELAEINGVTQRIEVSDLCQHADLERFAGERVFLICDIEGAEGDLLDPEKAPALGGFDILVEVHDGADSTRLRDLLTARFSGTHTIRRIPFEGRVAEDADRIAWIRKPEFLRRVVDEQRRLGLEWLHIKARRLNDK